MAVASVTTADVVRFVEAYTSVIAENRTYLTKLDSAIGDADHGENMNRGFQAALARLPDPADASPGEVLKTVAMALVSKVGGAAGPLYGTAFLRASAALGDKAELSADDVVEAIAAALEGVKMRGKSDVGDKTMIDALAPALEAAQVAVAAGGDVAAALTAAADAAEQGRDATIPMIARKGRASYLGERSAGHLDPGATSTALLFATLRCD